MLVAQLEREVLLAESLTQARVFRVHERSEQLISSAYPGTNSEPGGKLILAGGGVDRQGEIFEYIADLVPKGKAVVVDVEPTIDQKETIDEYTSSLRDVGVREFTVFTEETTQQEAREAIGKVAGVVGTGGDQYRLMNIWNLNGVGTEIVNGIKSGEVFASFTSATSAAAGKFLRRARPGEVAVQGNIPGMGLVARYVETHAKKRPTRLDRAIQRAWQLRTNALSLDEDTAVVLANGQIEGVLGTGTANEIALLPDPFNRHIDVLVSPVQIPIIRPPYAA